MKHPIALVAALASLVLMGAAVALAQDATPSVGAYPATIDPAECQVEARSVAEIIALRAAPRAGPPQARAVPAATTVEIPIGEAADAETVAGVTATIREVIACSGAGDFARLLALFSDDLARQIVAPDRLSEEDLQAALETLPEALPAGEQSTLLAITDVMELEDGRVGAFVVGPDAANVNRPDTIYVTLVREGDRWWVDAAVDFVVVNGADQDGD